MYLQLLILIATIVSVLGAPTESPDTQEGQNTVYDYSKYDTVYDQRQNGSVNSKVEVDGVVVVLTSPEAVLSSLMLLEPGLLEDYSDLEELLSSHKPIKPENLLEVSPERPSSSTTTALPASLVTGSNAAQEAQNNTARHETIIKRKFRLPMFIRPFLPRRQ